MRPHLKREAEWYKGKKILRKLGCSSSSGKLASQVRFLHLYNGDKSNWQLLGLCEGYVNDACVRPSVNTSRRSADKIHLRMRGRVTHSSGSALIHTFYKSDAERRHTQQSRLATGQTGEHSHVLLHLLRSLLMD